jgi:hypothetical protein
MAENENLPERRQRAAVSLNTPLNDLDQAWRLCEALAGSSLVPMALQGKPANILLVVMTGQELGLSVAQSLRTIYAPSSGNTQLRGQLVLAKLREAGHDYEFVQDEDSCTFTLIRGDNGRKYTGKFSMSDAVRAQLVQEHKRDDGTVEYLARSSNGKVLPWETYQPDMLFWRAVSRCVNRGAPEVMLGFSIMGAQEAEPQQGEVQLSPQPKPVAQAMSAAAEGTQAGQPTADTTASVAAAARPDLDPVRQELEQLNAEADDYSRRGPSEGMPAPEAPEQIIPEPERPIDEPQGGPAHRKQLGALTQRFKVLGWDPKSRRGDMLNACSAFVRRDIESAGDLTVAEAMAINATLAAIIQRNEPEQYAEILATDVRKWRAEWDDQT